ncbi:MAG: hypothetical protein ACRCTP_03715 [Aeromonas popoffii]|uniref:hypothetical protein n=1 Tax=Aeromonas popoffii TaxID=70856 RepID=UPI003F2C99B9
MGQGAESCGAYESEYDPYEENLGHGMWITRDEGEIHVSKMTLKHLKGARRRCEMMAKTASFTCDIWKWEDWVRIFDEESAKRDLASPTPAVKSSSPEVVIPSTPPQPARGKKISMVCFCGTVYPARLADLKRGWGLTCSKRCAAIKREFGRPPAKELGTKLSVKEILKRER